MKKKKGLAFTGIRSESDILLPVLKAMQAHGGFELGFVVSGAHLSDWHGNTLNALQETGIPIVDRVDNLLMTDRKVQRAKGVGLLTTAYAQVIEREQPDLVLYVGDREEGMALAIVANYMDVAMVHLAGGDPVFGNADDPVRFAISKLAHIHFAFTEVYAQNLLSIGEEAFRVFNTGNPSLDHIVQTPQIGVDDLAKHLGVDLSDGRYVVLIKHPLSSEKEEASFQMKSALQALSTFCQKHDMKVVGIRPNTDPGAGDLLAEIERYADHPQIHFFKTLEHDIFVNLVRHARCLTGNSSMGILEAPFYKLPVVNIGNRQQGRLNAGHLVFTDYNEDNLLKALEQACFDESYREKIAQIESPFGNGHSADNMASILHDIDLDDRKWYVKRKLC